MGRTFRVRVEDVRLPPNIPAGMDLGVIGGLAAMMRKTGEDPKAIRVKRCGDHWQVTDGRHRFVAAVVAGRVDVLAREK